MTQGPIFAHLMRFALPMLAGNLLQQLYNTVDTWVVGNFVNNTAFSAVGTVTPIINTLIGLFMGLANGAGVVVAQRYGAKRWDQVQEAVHTAVALTLVLGVVFTLVGEGMIPLMLRLMQTPAEVWPHSQCYLEIYFAGLMGLMLYNMGTGILQAIGNSRLPFCYLLICTVTNTILDLLFVIVFHMGIEGVAYATICPA